MTFLLWEILWQPLDFARDIRQSFDLAGSVIELVALENDAIVGGLVANRISDSEVELHHMAVRNDFQSKAVGKSLVGSLIALAMGESIAKIIVYARDASEGFYAKLGFKAVGERVEHPLFAKHGIALQQMHLKL